MQERPFLLLGSHALQTVSDRLHSALQAWASQWCPGERDYTVSATSAHPPLQASTLQQFSDGTADLWISTSDERMHATARCVLGEGWMASQGVPGDWSHDIVSRALGSQSQAVADSLLLGQVKPVAVVPLLPTSLFASGSGAVSLDCSTLGLRVWASRHVLRHVPPRPSAQPKSPLAPLAASLGGRTVPVTAVAGTVKLAAERLLDLAPGDVLRIGTLVEARAQIRLASGLTLAEGTLGQQAGRRALRLLDRTNQH
jgi:hypothetical protein